MPPPPDGALATFVWPEGDVPTVWAAWLVWRGALVAHLAEHPEDVEAVEDVLANVHVPDMPFSAADI